jgi:hypothetical protein
MPYFTQLDAPDLASLGDPLAARLIVALVFHDRESPTHESVSRLLTGYVTVTDKAIREYRAGREVLLAYARSNNQTVLMFEGVGRMETSINSAKRALRFLGRLSTSKSSVPLDRTLRRLSQSAERTLTPLRDAIEHIDADIMQPAKLRPGQAHLLAIDHGGQYLEIANHRITFVALAGALGTLHQAGVSLLESLPTINQAGARPGTT